jgi:hypothetical protein
MKRFLYAVGGLGLVSIVVIGILYARSPLSGTWSVSPFVPSATAPGMPAPIPTAAAGTLEGHTHEAKGLSRNKLLDSS